MGGKIVGHGLYGLTEAARYTRFHHSRLYRWFASEGGVFRSDYSYMETARLISFQDMIDALVAGWFRVQGVPLKEIRQAYNSLKGFLETEHPFCHNELYVSGRKILAKATEGMQRSMLFEAVRGQGEIEAVIQEHLKPIDYGQASKLAARWNIAQGILLDPNICFGKPVIKGTRVSTFALSKQYDANQQDAGFVAKHFKVSPDDVRRAVGFERSLKTRRAA